VKNTNTTLTAAVVLALGTTVSGQSVASDDQLIDVASGSLIEEGQDILALGNAVSGKYEIAMKKAAPKRKKAAPKR
jgi:hypothetical protein